MPVAPSSDASLLLKIHEFRRGTVHSGEFYNADPRSSALSIPDSRATSSSRRYTFDWSDAVTIGRLMDETFCGNSYNLESFSRLVVEVRSSKDTSSKDGSIPKGTVVQVPCTPASFVQIPCTPDLATSSTSMSRDEKVQVRCTPAFVGHCMSKDTQGVVQTSALEEAVSYYEWDYVDADEKSYATFSLIEIPRVNTLHSALATVQQPLSLDTGCDKGETIASAHTQTLPRKPDEPRDEFDDDTLLDEDFLAL